MQDTIETPNYGYKLIELLEGMSDLEREEALDLLAYDSNNSTLDNTGSDYPQLDISEQN